MLRLPQVLLQLLLQRRHLQVHAVTLHSLVGAAHAAQLLLSQLLGLLFQLLGLQWHP
jgi:hypothetical protein